MSNQISADSSTSSMWGGRFSEATDSFVAEFTASVGFDQRFAIKTLQARLLMPPCWPKQVLSPRRKKTKSLAV